MTIMESETDRYLLINTENEKIEIELLLEAVYRKYGYDFRNYAKASIKRRILHRCAQSGLKTVSELQHRILYDVKLFETLLMDFSINVTEMFRDPPFYRAVREVVFPVLKEYPHIKLWHAGCATGEEVYSMAIMLKEESLFEKTQIYATDYNENIIKKAKEGIYPLDKLKEYISNYQRAGGIQSFADYYTARYGNAVMNTHLKTNMVFADHNLVSDASFGEMDLIICRNVLIYFDRKLQDQAIGLFRESLSAGGFLCLGSKESLRFSKYSGDFEDVRTDERIYRKKTSQGQ
jgi:chemotaxis protein methyltransferase CheR